MLNDEIKKKINLKNLSKEKNNNKKIRIKYNMKKIEDEIVKKNQF